MYVSENRELCGVMTRTEPAGKADRSIPYRSMAEANSGRLRAPLSRLKVVCFTPHLLFCARRDVAAAAAAAAAATELTEGGFADEGGDDNEEVSTDAQLATRATYARHRHDLSLTWRRLIKKAGTDLGDAERVVKTSIALIKLEKAETEAMRSRHADNKPIAPGVAHAGMSTATATDANGRSWRFNRQIENQERPPRKDTGRVHKRPP